MIDQLFWNEKSGKLEIWDWKTNKKIDKKNKWQQFKNPISHLDVCELNTYSLQLSTYKHIVERNTNLRLGDSYIVWINEKNSKYEVFKCHDFKEEVINLLSESGDNPRNPPNSATSLSLSIFINLTLFVNLPPSNLR